MIEPPLHSFQEFFKKEKARFLEEWFTYLRFQSVSTDPSFHDECVRCSDWLRDHLQKMGFSSRILPTSGKPLVFAERKGLPGYPTVLFYGHYDVQPPDPLDRWVTPPFEPTIRGDRLYARGACDDKGPTFGVMKGLEVLTQSGLLHATIKILLEGEEECGSTGLTESLPTILPLCQADILLVCDTGTPSEKVGALTMGLRGVIHMDAVLKGPHTDLHSGIHGGLVKNPAIELAKMVAAFYRSDGSIAIPGYYDDLVSPSKEDIQLANQAPFTEEWYQGIVGVPPNGGEVGYSWAERRGFRPTLEVNGMISGYTGEGSKTIIPSEARVKLSARLGPGQDPQRCITMIQEFLRQQVPAGMELTFPHESPAGKALTVSGSHPMVQRASVALEKVYGAKPVYLWEGGSIPVLALLSEGTHSIPIMAGFDLMEDNLHAPNESFLLSQFEKTILFTAQFIGDLEPL